MLVENEADREQQNIGAFQLKRHLERFGITGIEMKPTPTKCSYDFKLVVHGLWLSAVEVRGINQTSETVLKKWGRVIIDEDKLTGLKEKFASKSLVTGKTLWERPIIFVFRCTKDDVCFTITMDKLLLIWPDVEDAPQEWMRSDHGKGQHKKKGWLIPVKYMERFK